MALWVFGYGSLLWNPGFDPEESVVATLEGYARSFCMSSIHHRGSEAEPGLVLALDEQPGSRCTGLAMKVRTDEEAPVLAMLRERELVSSAYLERMVDLTLSDGRMQSALAYVIDPQHVQYCGGLPVADQARIIARAHGGMGPNTEYLWNTARHLEDLGLGDAYLTDLSAKVRAIRG
ncbi:gamma-glutamylcyclotransferase [Pseudooceanicola aestuarii]|uniref:gamma-glutamylcyclotransferase n=1 Tax=Pseudooceanicola aestuarii TaxID=2697319 RepID=UPI0013D8A31C|nr:gamma-glutamylcyclotransferase [Pseudooceanicola aestuarii]